MSDRKSLAALGFAFGLVTFLAAGMASFIVIAEVQSQYVPTIVASGGPIGLAQIDSSVLNR